MPSIAVGAASPAVAASGTDAYGCTASDQAAIKTYVLTTYPSTLPDYTGVIMRAKHDQTPLALDGTVQIDYISFWNVGSKTVDSTANPFNVAVDSVRDASSTSTVLTTSRSWNIDGATTDMTKCAEAYWSAVAEWKAQAIGMRGLTFEQVATDVSTSSDWYDADTRKTVTVSTPNGTLDSRATGNFNSGSGEALAQNGIF